MVALRPAHRAARLGRRDFDSGAAEDLDEDLHRSPAAVVDGRAGPVEENRADPRPCAAHAASPRISRPGRTTSSCPPRRFPFARGRRAKARLRKAVARPCLA